MEHQATFQCLYTNYQTVGLFCLSTTYNPLLVLSFIALIASVVATLASLHSKCVACFLW